MRPEMTYRKSRRSRSLLDATSGHGCYPLGRKPEGIQAALNRAARGTDQGNFPMISAEKANLAEALARVAPGALDCVVYGVMRGEAMEFAAKIVRGRTNRMPLVTTAGNTFGETGFALSLSDRPGKDRFGPLTPGIRTVPFFDREALARELSHGAAGLFLEPIQVEHGCRVLLPDDLRYARELCDRHKALLVVDETRTAFGRTGFRFACDAADVVPDVLIVGESLGAGVFPITAAIFTPDINRFLNDHPMIHLSTFGGSDVGCRVGLAALAEFERLEVWENARDRGAQLRLALEQGRMGNGALQAIRGRGLLLGLEMVDEVAARRVVKRAARAGIHVRRARFVPQVVVIEPPLIISREETSLLASGLLEALLP